MAWYKLIIQRSLVEYHGIYRQSLVRYWNFSFIVSELVQVNPDNRPFPSYLVPPFQNESLCKTFHIKMSLICMKITCRQSTFPYEWFRTKTRFDTEAKGNSERAYSLAECVNL